MPVAAAEITHQAAGFLHHQAAGGHVPLRQADLPEPIQPTSGHIGQVQCRGTCPAHVGALAHQGAKRPQIAIHVLWKPKRETRAEQRTIHARALAYANSAVVEHGSLAARGDEHLFAKGVVDNPRFSASPVPERDGHGEVRHSMQKVGRSIQGIDDPLVDGVGLGRATLLGEDRMVWVQGVNHPYNLGFRLPVDLGNEVVTPLAGHAQLVHAVNVPADVSTGLAGRPDGDGGSGVHVSGLARIKRPRIVAEPMKQVRVVLVEPSHPGNIGATARAMKTMGLRDLRLVNPKRFPDAEASARATGALDVLERATIHDSLGAATADCAYVLGCSARTRSLPWPVLSPRDACGQILHRPDSERAALVFGRERSGLDNRELEHCSALVHIPTDEQFRSLNLAGAVQVLAYELRVAWLAEGKGQSSYAAVGPRASNDEIARLYEHLEAVLVRVGFLDPANPRLVMRRLKRLFSRAALEPAEVNILRGFLTAVERTRYWRKPPDSGPALGEHGATNGDSE